MPDEPSNPARPRRAPRHDFLLVNRLREAVHSEYCPHLDEDLTAAADEIERLGEVNAELLAAIRGLITKEPHVHHSSGCKSSRYSPLPCIEPTDGPCALWAALAAIRRASGAAGSSRPEGREKGGQTGWT